MSWEVIRKWFRIGANLGFQLLREECRHCNGKGICHSGRSEWYGISCASCQRAALGEVATHVVRCDVCDGRGVFVYALPSGNESSRVAIDVLPRNRDDWSTLRVRSLEDKLEKEDVRMLPPPPDVNS